MRLAGKTQLLPFPQWQLSCPARILACLLENHQGESSIELPKAFTALFRGGRIG